MYAHKIAFIGAGHMSRALIGGLCAAGIDPRTIAVTGKNAARRDQIAADYGVRAVDSNPDALRNADLVVLAVKPQHMIEVLEELRSAVARERPLVVSIAAGIRLHTLMHDLGGYPRVVRTMPNRPSLLGCGMTALCASSAVSPDERAQVEEVLRTTGETVWVEREEQMDAVTAVCGCGPAYFFLLMELLEETARELGLCADVARKLSVETAYGAACMARGHMDNKQRVYDDPAQLRAQVASPGGSTEAALKVLSDADLRGIVRRAVTAAAHRSAQLAQEFGKH